MKNIKKLSTYIGTLITVASPIAFLSCGEAKGSDEKQFDFTNDLTKLDASLISTKIKTALKTDVGSKEIKGAVTAHELGISNPELSKDVMVTYAIKTQYVDTIGVIVVAATLTKGAETSTKDITITAKTDQFDFNEDLAKVINVTSTKTKSLLYATVKLKTIGSDVTSNELGISSLALSSGVEVAYRVAIIYNNDSGMIILTATLTKGAKKVFKKITITAKSDPFDFQPNLNKISRNVTSSKIETTLSNVVGTKQIGDIVTATELGYTEPEWISGVTASYVVASLYDTTLKSIGITVTLTKGKETATQLMTIQADSLVKMLKRYYRVNWSNVTLGRADSTKTASQLRTAVGDKMKNEDVTAVELGINQPDISRWSGVSIIYKVTNIISELDRYDRSLDGTVAIRVKIILSRAGEDDLERNIVITAD